MQTVKDWIAILKQLPQDAVLIVSSDPEGNNFSPVDESVGLGFWDTKENEPVFTEDEEDLKPTKRQPRAVFLYPN